MPTLFSLIIAWELITMLGLVLVPFLVTRHTDSAWSEPGRIGVMSLACAVSTIHGAMAFLISHRRGGSPWHFLWGALLMPIGLLIVWNQTKAKPETTPVAPPPILAKLDRVCFMMGNIWWGIAQLIAILLAIMPGTLYESTAGGTIGNEAAYASFFNAPWFGALCIIFFMTLYCATMRKFPFRISQIGWLTVHSGLLLTLIGCMIMFWGTYSGRVQLLEGETDSVSLSTDYRELHVDCDALGIHEKFLVSADTHPDRSDVKQEIRLEKDGKRFDITIDRYYSSAHWEKRLVATSSTENAETGVAIKVIAPGITREEFLLEKTNPHVEFGSILGVRVERIENELELEGFTKRYGAGETTRGTLVVRNRSGGELARMTVVPGARGSDPGKGADLTSLARDLGTEGLQVKPLSYYSYIAQNETAGIYDHMPGTPVSPGMMLAVEGPKGTQQYVVIANRFFTAWPRGKTPLYDLQFEYECVPQRDLRSIVVVALGPGDRRSAVVADRDGNAEVTPLELDKPYRFSEDAPVKVVVKSVVPNATIREGWEQNTAKMGGRRVIRVRMSDDNDSAQHWVVQLAMRAQTFQLGPHRFDVSYQPRRRDLGFSLSLLDFRQTNYPNSTKPKTYESNVILRDPEAGIEEAILIDMNHPLSYKGYRFFNSSPIIDRDFNRRGVVFQVGRNPGRGTIYFGSFVVTIGLILVFFYKPKLRKWEQRRAKARREAVAAADTNAPAPVAEGV